MARPLRRAGRDGLLARRAQTALHLQPADDLLGLRGRRDAARASSPRHRRGDRDQHHRQPRRVDHRLRVLRAAQLPPDAALQADRQAPALRPRAPHRQAVDRDRAGDLRAHDRLGPDRPELQRARQVRHRPETRHRRSPATPFGASSAAAPDAPPTRHSTSSVASDGRSSSATTSPTRRSATKSTKAARSSSTETAASTSSTTAKTPS